MPHEIRFYSCNSPSIINCSFYSNTAASGSVEGSGIANYGNSVPAITNCIIFQNGAVSDGIANVSGASANVSYSIVQGGTAGTGNLNTNPLFVNPAAGDLRLQACSPAINAGNSIAVPAGTNTGIAGNTRFFNAAVDLGAYENGTLPTTFKGTGNWNVIGSWQCNWVPPSPLPPGYEIIVDPVGGNCLLNVPFTVGPGGKLTVKTGKKLVVQGNLQVQ